KDDEPRSFWRDLHRATWRRNFAATGGTTLTLLRTLSFASTPDEAARRAGTKVRLPAHRVIEGVRLEFTLRRILNIWLQLVENMTLERRFLHYRNRFYFVLLAWAAWYGLLVVRRTRTAGIEEARSRWPTNLTTGKKNCLVKRIFLWAENAY